MPDPKAYIIVLNHRTKEETVRCLLGLEGLSHRAFEVIVVDNASGNGSLEHIQAAVQGRITYPLHAVALPRNAGFGAGMNAGLRLARARRDARYYWLLNNDAVPAPGALSALLRAAEEDRAAGRRVGQYGSKLLYRDRPGVIQAVGGAYNPWLGVTREIGNLEEDRGQHDAPAPRADILIGAAMLVTEEFLDGVGLMAEDHFLYYEEHDWAARARRRGWGLRVVPGSAVLHAQGATIGASGERLGEKSLLADFYSFRNRLLVTLRHYPWCLPTVLLASAGILLRRARRGQWDRIPMMLRLMATFFLKPGMTP